MRDNEALERREFIERISAFTIAALTAQGLFAADERQGDMIYRKLGKTGERVSAIGLGGAHIGRPEEKEATRIIRTAIDKGINFLDNCWDYSDGKCEVWMGNALRDGYRQKVFLMTKFDGRNKATTAKQIDESLRRLQTDRIDLMQYHENIRMEDPGSVLRRRRAARRPARSAARRARSATSASPATRIRPCICGCSKWRRRAAFTSTRRRCRSTYSTPSSAVSRTRSCRSWCSRASACWA